MILKSIRGLSSEFLILTFAIALAWFGCKGAENVPADGIPLPFPDEKMSKFYQSRIDSSEFEWFTDVKAAASSFINEMGFVEGGVSTSDIIILGEGLFHAKVEVELPDRIMVLTMERPYKHRGKNSIWQVIAVEEKEWPKKK
jgi:hypothetical protein